jgi:glycerol-3-phosphate dehydrogenase subunit B
MRADVVVIGAGPAGLATAARLLEAGRKVRLISRGNGFTHWGAGAVDVLARAGGRRLDRPGDGIGELPPQHPYRLLGAAPLRSGLEWFQRAAAGLGLDLVGDPDVNRQQVTGLGTLRTTCLLPAPAAGELSGQVAVIGFDGFRDFSPALCAAGLERRAAREGLNGARITTGTVELPEWNHQRYFTGIELAQAIDDEVFRSKLAPGLARSAAGASTAIVPAVLGLREGHKAWADLERRTGLRLVEAAIPPPSVPGLRLFNGYRRRLTGSGARWQFGFPAIAVHGAGGRITAVRCEGAAREITVECEDLVLATGGVAGHGIEARRDGSMVEVVAKLPVAGFPDRGGFVAAHFLGEHPLAAAGVRVDSELRPVDASGTPIYTNLRCVGGLLSDHDPTSEGSREGVALASASRVAELLAPATTGAAAGNGGTAR